AQLGDGAGDDREGADEGDELPGLSDALLRLLKVGGKGRTGSAATRGPARGRGGELGRSRRLDRGLPHRWLLGRGHRADGRTHVAALAAERDCAAAGLADRHTAISGLAARTSVTVVQQKTRRPRDRRAPTPARPALLAIALPASRSLAVLAGHLYLLLRCQFGSGVRHTFLLPQLSRLFFSCSVSLTTQVSVVLPWSVTWNTKVCWSA